MNKQRAEREALSVLIDELRDCESCYSMITRGQPTIGVIATLDTKAPEALYLKGLMASKRFEVKIVDISMLRHSSETFADISSTEVALAAGVTPDEVYFSKDRNFGTITMGNGLGKILTDLVRADKLDGVISVGGAQGTSISSAAFKSLPIGFPKLIVSAVASGNVRPFVGASDIMMMFSVADLNGGINTITGTVLSNAAAAMMGMTENGKRLEIAHEQRIVGITSWGTTQRAVMAAASDCRSRGFEPVIFHSSGACTSAMEALVGQGVIDAVLDLTTHDIVGEIFSQEVMRPVNFGRLTNAAKRGIPLIVAPGGLNTLVMGPYDELQAEYKNRQCLKHNPAYTEVRVTLDELLVIAELVAERLNSAKGYCAFIVPSKGWNDYDAPGAGLYNPEDDDKFIKRLRELVSPKVEFYQYDGNLNEAAFGRLAVEVLAKHLLVP